MAIQVLVVICSTPAVIVLLVGWIRAEDTAAPYARREWWVVVGLGLQARGGEVRAHDRRGRASLRRNRLPAGG